MGKTIAQLGRYLDLIITKTAELGYAAKPIESSLSGETPPTHKGLFPFLHVDRYDCGLGGDAWGPGNQLAMVSVDLPSDPVTKGQRGRPGRVIHARTWARTHPHTRGTDTTSHRRSPNATGA